MGDNCLHVNESLGMQCIKHRDHESPHEYSGEEREQIALPTYRDETGALRTIDGARVYEPFMGGERVDHLSPEVRQQVAEIQAKLDRLKDIKPVPITEEALKDQPDLYGRIQVEVMNAYHQELLREEEKFVKKWKQPTDPAVHPKDWPQQCPSRYQYNPGDYHECQLPEGHAGSHRQGTSSWETVVSVPGATWCLRAFHDLPLTMKMRASADVLDECNRRGAFADNVKWRASALREVADTWEREEAEEAGKEKAVEELAATISETGWLSGAGSVRVAQILIDAGWTKVTHDE
jgi:hypothetical protein